MSDSPITVDVDTTEVKTEKSKKRQPNQNYPLLTREQCMPFAKKLMDLRKHKLQKVNIEDIFSANGHDNPRIAWQAYVVYSNAAVLNTLDKMVNWMIDFDRQWLEKHPPTGGPLNDSKEVCHTCGTEMKWKRICPHCTS